MDNVWIHKKTGNKYKVISENARMKDMTMPDRWVDCVIYSPMYENEYEMFSRAKYDFYNSFEKEKTVKDKIDELWNEYHKCCYGCVGNGCDDCRGCKEVERKYEIYKEIKSLTNNEN